MLGLRTATRRLCVAAGREASTRDQEWEDARPFEHIPGPEPWPIIGNLWTFLPYIGRLSNITDLRTLHRLILEDYGPIARFERVPGRRTTVVVYDPADAEKVFRNDGLCPIRSGLESFDYYRQVTQKDFFEGAKGLLTSQGEAWLKFRNTVKQPLLQQRISKQYIAPIDEVATDFVKRFPALLDERNELPADFHNELCKWGLETLTKIALDTRLGCFDPDLKPDSETQRMIDSVHIIFDSMFKMDVASPLWKVVSTPTWRKLVTSLDLFREVSMKYIYEAIERNAKRPVDSEREPNILERILARDPNPKVACVMAIDMMSAGVDTSSSTTAILLYYLAKNPDKQRKLQAEVDRVVPKSLDQPITDEHIDELKYLKACLKESMRLMPVVLGNFRTLTKDVVLQNYRVPKGTDVLIDNTMMSRMEKNFVHPDDFIPERWLKGDPDAPPTQHKINPFASLPFGFGPRMCVGRRVAELEMQVLVAKIMRNYSLEWHHGPMTFESKVLNKPTTPLRFKLIKRE